MVRAKETYQLEERREKMLKPISHKNNSNPQERHVGHQSCISLINSVYRTNNPFSLQPQKGSLPINPRFPHVISSSSPHIPFDQKSPPSGDSLKLVNCPV
ncbi:BA75_03158T0 [Komagataella pastoris]|uniref:BA75_03158T0 n=1 Tax=Komagataella pastoris TaxID=4922 RepID=A0A1B2JDV6_PICPA|nr:BA75_03158T0 [Komagataella pastoris]